MRTSRVGVAVVRCAVATVLLGVSLVATEAACGAGSVEGGQGAAVLSLTPRVGKAESFTILITETVYVNDRKATNIYRHDMKVTNSLEGNEIRKAVAVVGSVMSEGRPLRSLGSYSYSLLMGRDGRIVSAEGLHPWDGRVIETLWLGQVLLPEGPVAVGDSWTLEGIQIGTGYGTTVLEKRTYTLVGYESVGDLSCALVEYQITNRGKCQDGAYTYICKGRFWLGDGRVVKLTSSEVLSVLGTTIKKKALTTIQVDCDQ